MINKNIIDNTYILPCLQETKKFPIDYFEQEQEGSIIYNNNFNSIGKNTSSTFYNYWNKTNLKNNEKNETILNNILNNDERISMIVPRLIPENINKCKDLYDSKSKTSYGIWELLLEFMLSKLKNGGTFVIVSHHNRIKKTLLPIIDKKICNGYANCFTLRIEISNNSLNIEVVFSGYPDRGTLPENCDKTMTGGSNYKYCCNNTLGNINFNYFKKSFDKVNHKIKSSNKYVIYVVRHGNTLHNQPTKKLLKNKTYTDSNLTPLGIFQAISLGKKLSSKKYIKDDFFNNDVLYGASYQSRSQLTGLLFLNTIYNTHKQRLPKKLNHDLKLLKNVSLIRFNEKLKKVLENNTIQDIYNDSLLNLDKKEFNKYCKTLYTKNKNTKSNTKSNTK